MGWGEKRKRKGFRRLLHSFVYAFQGLYYVLRHEQNMQIHLGVSLLIIVFGLMVELSPLRWAILMIVIGGVIALEMVNTAIERLVDLVSSDYHPLAGIVKDVAASAVLIFSMIAVVVGIIIFF